MLNATKLEFFYQYGALDYDFLAHYMRKSHKYFNIKYCNSMVYLFFPFYLLMIGGNLSYQASHHQPNRKYNNAKYHGVIDIATQ